MRRKRPYIDIVLTPKEVERIRAGYATIKQASGIAFSIYLERQTPAEKKIELYLRKIEELKQQDKGVKMTPFAWKKKKRTYTLRNKAYWSKKSVEMKERIKQGLFKKG